MAKISLKQREKKRYKLVDQLLGKRNRLKENAKNAESMEERMELLQKLDEMSPNSSPVRRRRRCRVCGRPHGVYRKFQLCRIHLREFLMRGDVPGGRKSSW